MKLSWSSLKKKVWLQDNKCAMKCASEQLKQKMKMYKPYKSQKYIKATLFILHRAIGTLSTEGSSCWRGHHVCHHCGLCWHCRLPTLHLVLLPAGTHSLHLCPTLCLFGSSQGQQQPLPSMSRGKSRPKHTVLKAVI